MFSLGFMDLQLLSHKSLKASNTKQKNLQPSHSFMSQRVDPHPINFTDVRRILPDFLTSKTNLLTPKLGSESTWKMTKNLEGSPRKNQTPTEIKAAHEAPRLGPKCLLFNTQAQNPMGNRSPAMEMEPTGRGGGCRLP